MENFPLAARALVKILKFLAKLPVGGAWMQHPIAVFSASLGRPEQAISAYQTAISRDRSWNRAIYRHLGQAQLACGKLRDAEQSFRQAIDREPYAYESHQGLGETLAAQNLPARAELAFRAALDLAPGHGWLPFLLVRSLAAQSPAIQRIDPLIDAVLQLPKSQGPTGIRFPWYLLRREGCTEARLCAVQKLWEKFPNDIEITVFLARMLSYRGEYGGATHLLEQASGLKWAQDYPGGVSARVNGDRLKVPGFMIIGQLKAATTALHVYLCRHPRVAGPLIKEVRYFSDFPEAGTTWYLSHFPPIPENSEMMTGEATPFYFHNPGAPHLICKTFPQMKLILLLREPVARAYSEFQMWVRLGFEHRSWEQVVAEELETLPNIPLDQIDIDRIGDSTVREKSILLNSVVTPYLSRWLGVFPRNQLLIVRVEELQDNGQVVLDRVCEFLALPQMPCAYMEPVNKGEYDAMARHVEQKLNAYFTRDQQALEQVLGQVDQACFGS